MIIACLGSSKFEFLIKLVINPCPLYSNLYCPIDRSIIHYLLAEWTIHHYFLFAFNDTIICQKRSIFYKSNTLYIPVQGSMAPARYFNLVNYCRHYEIFLIIWSMNLLNSPRLPCKQEMVWVPADITILVHKISMLGTEHPISRG